METKTPELLRRQLLSSAVLASIAVVGTVIIAFARLLNSITPTLTLTLTLTLTR